MLFFEIDDNKNIVGLTDVQANAEAISRLIKERITPYPSFILAAERENGRDVLGLSMSAGRSATCYYKADVIEACIRMDTESEIAPSYILKAIPHHLAAALTMYFPLSVACKIFDLPPVNLRILPLHLKKALVIAPPHLCGIALMS